jgi:hypothetical protein
VDCHDTISTAKQGDSLCASARLTLSAALTSAPVAMRDIAIWVCSLAIAMCSGDLPKNLAFSQPCTACAVVWSGVSWFCQKGVWRSYRQHETGHFADAQGNTFEM